MEQSEREILLKQLQSISFTAFLTALTTEMCLEVNILNSNGLSYSWIGYEDWPLFKLIITDTDKLSKISNKINNETLYMSDINITVLRNFVNQIVGEQLPDYDYSQLLLDLVHIPVLTDHTLFAYYGSDCAKVRFFADQDEFRRFLNDKYCTADTMWDQMVTDELEYWWSRVKDEGEDIPCTIFDDDY